MNKLNFSHLFLLATLASCHPFNTNGELSWPDGVNDIPYGAFPPLSTYDGGLPSAAATASIPAGTAQPTNDVLLGKATVQNNCRFPIYAWPVGRTIHSEITVAPSSKYSEIYRTAEGGIALKIGTDSNALLRHSPLLIFAYNIVNGKVWYDLSDVSGHPFKGHRVEINPSSPHISWTDGSPPGGSQIRVLDSSASIVLTLC